MIEEIPKKSRLRRTTKDGFTMTNIPIALGVIIELIKKGVVISDEAWITDNPDDPKNPNKGKKKGTYETNSKIKLTAWRISYMPRLRFKEDPKKTEYSLYGIFNILVFGMKDPFVGRDGKEKPVEPIDSKVYQNILDVFANGQYSVNYFLDLIDGVKAKKVQTPTDWLPKDSVKRCHIDNDDLPSAIKRMRTIQKEFLTRASLLEISIEMMNSSHGDFEGPDDENEEPEPGGVLKKAFEKFDPIFLLGGKIPNPVLPLTSKANEEKKKPPKAKQKDPNDPPPAKIPGKILFPMPSEVTDRLVAIMKADLTRNVKNARKLVWDGEEKGYRELWDKLVEISEDAKDKCFFGQGATNPDRQSPFTKQDPFPLQGPLGGSNLDFELSQTDSFSPIKILNEETQGDTQEEEDNQEPSNSQNQLPATTTKANNLVLLSTAAGVEGEKKAGDVEQRDSKVLPGKFSNEESETKNKKSKRKKISKKERAPVSAKKSAKTKMRTQANAHSSSSDDEAPTTPKRAKTTTLLAKKPKHPLSEEEDDDNTRIPTPRRRKPSTPKKPESPTRHSTRRDISPSASTRSRSPEKKKTGQTYHPC